jgi:hypothetical protein
MFTYHDPLKGGNEEQFIGPPLEGMGSKTY